MMMPTPSHRQRFDRSFDNAGQNLMQAIAMIQSANEKKQKDERQATLDAQASETHAQNKQINQMQLAEMQGQAQDRDLLRTAETRLVGVDAGLPNQGMTGPLQVDPTTQPFSGANPSPLLTNEKRAANEARLKDTLIAEIRTRRGQAVTAEDLGKERSEREAKAKAEREDAMLLGGLRKAQTAGEEASTAETRRRTELLGQPKPTDPKDAYGTEDSMRKEFTQLNSGFKEVASALGRVQASAENPSAAGDMSLIFAYMKMLDPGSTVREGEQAQAEQARGVPASVLSLYNKALTGEKLDTKQRGDFTGRAQKLFEREMLLYENRKEQFTEIAKTRGLNPNSVILDYTTGSQGASGNTGGGGAAAPVQIKGDADYEKLAPGTLFIGSDGMKRRKP